MAHQCWLPYRHTVLAVSALVLILAIWGCPVSADPAVSLSAAEAGAGRLDSEFEPDFELDDLEQAEFERRHLVGYLGEDVGDAEAAREGSMLVEDEEGQAEVGDDDEEEGEVEGTQLLEREEDNELDLEDESVSKALGGRRQLLRTCKIHKKLKKYVCTKVSYRTKGYQCCNGRCLNVVENERHCGKCHKRCRAKVIRKAKKLDDSVAVKARCCKGKCYNALTSKKHCGKCGKKCKKGVPCVNGKCTTEY